MAGERADRVVTATNRSNSLVIAQTLLIVLTAISTLVILMKPGTDHFTMAFANLAQLCFAGVAAAAGLVAARVNRGRTRISWLFLSAGALAWAIGQALWCWQELISDHLSPFPSSSDPFFLFFPTFALVGLWLFPSRDGPNGRSRRVLDALVIVSSLMSISWSTTLVAVVRAGGDTQIGLFVALAYPISDILIVTIALLGLSRASGHRGQLITLVLAMIAMGTADSGFAYLTAMGTYETGNPLDLGWLAAFLLISLAATGAIRSRWTDQATTTNENQPAASMLPYASLIVAILVLVIRYATGYRPGQVELVSLGLAMIFVMLRQYLTLIDNRNLLRALAARERQLQNQAFHDQLTGLANRELFTNRVAHALALHQRDGRPIALMFCDLDDFKAVNDTLGHAAGDELLIQVAQRLRGAVRAGDTLARFGGDEFAILIEDGGEANTIGLRILAALQTPFHLAHNELRIQASVGVIEVTEEEPIQSAESLVAKADLAMYAAKRKGKGRIAWYDPDTILPSNIDLRMREPLAHAVESGTIRLNYRPIIELQGLTTVGLQAHANWSDGGPAVPSTDFFPVSARSGLVAQLTDQLLDRACAELTEWSQPLLPHRLMLGLPLPPGLISDPQFPDRIRHMLRRHELLGSQLMFVITDSVLVSDLPQAIITTSRLAEIGVRLCLEDFATGQSSLMRVQQMPFDSIRFNLESIPHTNGDNTKFLTAMAALSEQLNLDVYAVGIRNIRQVDLLRRYGFHAAIGDYFGSAVTAEDVPTTLGLHDEPTIRLSRRTDQSEQVH